MDTIRDDSCPDGWDDNAKIVAALDVPVGNGRMVRVLVGSDGSSAIPRGPTDGCPACKLAQRICESCFAEALRGWVEWEHAGAPTS
jgi:hypothetical protein